MKGKEGEEEVTGTLTEEQVRGRGKRMQCWRRKGLEVVRWVVGGARKYVAGEYR